MSIFRDKSALEFDRLDVDVVCRESEVGRLRDILSDVDSGFLPGLISVYGPPGNGKTLVVRKVCEEFEESQGGKFRVLYVNLGEARTVFGCGNRLVSALGGRWMHGRHGLDGVMEEFWRRIRDWEGDGKRFILIVLDEADHLFLDERGDPSGFLYRLVRSKNRLEGSGINLSLLTISNKPLSDVWELDARVRSSMGSEEIIFTPYSTEELKEILNNRIAAAFRKNAFDPEVIDALVLNRSQVIDVRKMYELLRLCGEVADANNVRKVRMKHYERALAIMNQDHNLILISRLPYPHQHLLKWLGWTNVVQSEETARVSRLYTLYVDEQIGWGDGREILSYRRVAGVLKELEVMDIIGSRTTSRGRGGRMNEVWLKIPGETVMDFTCPKWKIMKDYLERKKKQEDKPRKLDKNQEVPRKERAYFFNFHEPIIKP